ncbi:T9SS type A sorting domain-containing protein [Roseivirga pacifica]|uniref:T9SS type A sorting domain-containing protein n=1 Tax=Roseivirga pacifica TaxID=1267423 RepID=UPI003BAD8500
MRLNIAKTFALVTGLFFGLTVHSQTPITSATFNNVSTGLSSSSYSAVTPSDAGGGMSANTTYTVNYGQGQNQFITNYTLGSTLYDNFVLPDTLIIQRTDAGRQLIIFYEHLNIDTAPDPDHVNIQPEQQDNEEALYQSGLSNAGYDNILVNNATNFANVERIDIIYYTGVVTSTPANAVFPIVERNGNDDIRVAAIRGLDGDGKPNDYYPTVVRIRNDDGDWGNLGVSHTSIVLRRQSATSNPLPQDILGAQNLHGTAVSFSEFGIGPDEIVYGYSIFADDVTATGDDLIDITNPSIYPTNTSETSGLDLIAGISTAVASDDNLRKATGPGGYKSALNTWLKANAGVTTATDGGDVTFWEDQFLGNHDATTLTTSPTYRDGSSSGLDDINFNPTVDFIEATATGLQIADNTDFNTATSYERKSISFAIRTGNDVSTKQQIFEQGSTSRGLNIYLRNGDIYVGAWNEINDGAGAPWSFDAVSASISTDTEYIVTLEFDGNNTTTGELRAYINGQLIGTISNIGLIYADTGDIGLGNVDGQSRYDDGITNASSFYGSIPEMIYCNEPSAFSATGRNSIESYLALKYGITLDQNTPKNYYNSKGTVIYNTSTSASIGGYLEYNNDIAGIGRDDESEFEQLVSQSENNGSLVRISRNSAIGTDNSWLIWGNDGGALTETATWTPDTIDYRLTRVWRVAEQNNIGVTDISFDIEDLGLGSNPNEFSLLVSSNSSNGDFTNAEIITDGVISTIDGRTFITFSDVDLSSGEYFTLGTDYYRCSPGGVETELVLWYKANQGTNTITNGNNVTSWLDQTALANNATEANMGGTPEEPTFATNTINFNPTIRFTDPNSTANSYLESASSPVTGDMTLLAVFATTQNEGTGEFWSSPALIGAESSGTTADFALGLSGGQVHAKIAAGDGLGTRSPLSYADGQPRIATATREQAASGLLALFIDGENVANGTSDNNPLSDPTVVGIGNHSDPIQSAQFAGDIAEVMIFSHDLSNEERNRVESYAAIKYGITRNDSDDGTTPTVDERDYRSAGGLVLWDYDGQGASFYNDIAGIGRDDLSCLDQRQSRSINNDAVVTFGLEEIASDNFSNLNTFANNESALLWGNDNASTLYANRTTGISLGTVTERMTRVWRVDETTNDTGEASVSFDLSGLGYSAGSISDFQLIVSDNSDLSTPTLYQAATYEGDVVTFSGINMNDAQYFTLGTARTACGPGGVTNDLYVWLRADAGTSTTTNNTTLSTWSDRSGNTNNATDDGTPPLFKDNTTDNINFNPTLDFDGEDDRLSLGNLSQIKSGATNNGDYTMIGVGIRQDGPQWNFVLGSPGGTGNTSLHFGYRDNNSAATLAHWGNDIDVGTNAFDNPQAPFLLYGEYDGSQRIIEETRGGNFARNSGGNTGDIEGSTANYIGDVESLGNYNGLIPEVIVFENDISDISKLQIYTYLGLKYGITLGNNNDGDGSTNEVISGSIREGDYLASDGSTVIWTYANNSAYHNDVAGIGRDDSSCWQQKQSRAEDTDDIVTIGLGSIATNNYSNANTFEDHLDYFIWGNNSGATNQASATTGDTPSSISQRMTRVWRVEDTGNVGETEIQFDLTGLGYGPNAEDFRLMIADNVSGGSMASASLIEGGTFNGSVLSFEGIDLADGEYFTLGVVEQCGPGGVNTNVALWLRADEQVYSDAGTTLATEDDDTQQWNDQTTFGRNANETNGGGGTVEEPVFRENFINFNPAIFISDQNTTNNSYLRTATSTNTVSGDMTLISVFTTNQNQGTNNEIDNTPSLIGAEDNTASDDYGLGVYQGEVVFNAANTNSFTARSTTTYNNGEPFIATGTRVQAASGAVALYVNSLLVGTGTSDNTALDEPDTWAIGNQNDYDNEAQFQGNIAEVLVFSQVLSAEEQARVESYLALKYGITRSNDSDNDATTNELVSGSIREGDYVAADGTVIWNYADRGASYFNDIAGIGRDDLSCFNQNHSKSENDDAIVDISIDDFASDEAFLIWGNDGAAIEAEHNDERPSGINSRLNREWQVQETGTVGTVNLTFNLWDVTGTPLGANNYNQMRLMVDTDDDFSDATTLITPSSYDSYAKTVTFQVDFNASEGYFYTLGSEENDALPITLVEFGAFKNENTVDLKWTTVSEENNQYFTIERNYTGLDEFETIGIISGAQNSDDLKSYVYKDASPYQGTNYYRLKQTDFNGSYTYSKVVSATISTENKIDFNIYPNPSDGSQIRLAFIGLIPSDIVELQIISNSGRIIKQGKVNKTQFHELKNLALEAGLYYVRIKVNNNYALTKRLIIQ